MSYKLLYIGKSNKFFTNGRFYYYEGINDSKYLYVKTNKNNIKQFLSNHNPFEYVDEKKYNNLIRKNKLKKINNKI